MEYLLQLKLNTDKKGIAEVIKEDIDDILNQYGFKYETSLIRLFPSIVEPRPMPARRP